MKKLSNKKFMDLLIVFIVITILSYTFGVMLLTLKGHTVPDSLTNCFFAFFGTELISMATIKVKKVKYRSDVQSGNDSIESNIK